MAPRDDDFLMAAVATRRRSDGDERASERVARSTPTRNCCLSVRIRTQAESRQAARRDYERAHSPTALIADPRFQATRSPRRAHLYSSGGGNSPHHRLDQVVGY